MPKFTWTADSRFGTTANFLHFLNEDTMALGYASSFALLQQSGTVVMTVNLPRKQVAESVLASRDGREFALVSLLLGGVEIPALDVWHHALGRRVVVYETATKAEGLALEIKPARPDTAISSDGGMLAAIVNDEVRLFDLRVSDSPHH